MIGNEESNIPLVTLNKWNGRQFEINNRCHNCGSYAATRNFAISPTEVKDPTVCGANDHIIVKLCKSCLNDFMVDIDQATMDSLPKGK